MLEETATVDRTLLDSIPEFLSFQVMMKATPKQEGGRRIIYIQASDETIDAQGERILRKALEDSAKTFTTYGSLDIDHYTMTGARQGIPNYHEYEIGRPVEVRFDGDKTFVKAELYQGDTPLARNANMVWDSMTKLSPPAAWFPSVGGSVLSKSVVTDSNGMRTPVVNAVRWTNLALSRHPVNQNVPVAQTVPFGALAKCWGAHGLDLSKALTATPASTDVATLNGGAALARQSLDWAPQNYFDFRDRMAGDVRRKRAAPRPEAMIDHAAEHYGLDHAQAAEWTERFMGDLASTRRKRIPA